MPKVSFLEKSANSVLDAAYEASGKRADHMAVRGTGNRRVWLISGWWREKSASSMGADEALMKISDKLRPGRVEGLYKVNKESSSEHAVAPVSVSDKGYAIGVRKTRNNDGDIYFDVYVASSINWV